MTQQARMVGMALARDSVPVISSSRAATLIPTADRNLFGSRAADYLGYYLVNSIASMSDGEHCWMSIASHRWCST
jgi:hypothetical protein